jgi:hypothetical protein
MYIILSLVITNNNYFYYYFEDRGVRKIFGARRDEVTGGCIKLHNEKRHDLYNPTDITIIMKSKSIRWTGHVARMGGR